MRKPGVWGGCGIQRLAGLLLALALPLLPACRQDDSTISVPVSDWPGYEYFYLAHQLGLDRSLGITINPLLFPDPQAIVHAYLRGQIPLAQLTTVEVVDICARDHKRCPVVVLVLNESRGGDRIAVVDAVPSLKDLKGRSVAVTYSTLGPYVLSRALEKQGLRLSDVQLRNIPLSEMPNALKAGEVDAAVFFPPYSDYAARDGGSRVLFDSQDIPGEVFDVLAVDPAYLKKHPARLVSLVKAWSAAHLEADRQPEKAIGLMARRERLSVQEFRQSEQGLVYFPLVQQQEMLAPKGLLARNLQAVKAVQVRLGLLPADSPLPEVSSRSVREALP